MFDRSKGKINDFLHEGLQKGILLKAKSSFYERPVDFWTNGLLCFYEQRTQNLVMGALMYLLGFDLFPWYFKAHAVHTCKSMHTVHRQMLVKSCE